MSESTGFGGWPSQSDPDATHVAADEPRQVPARPGDARRYRAVRLHARGSLGEVHVAIDDELNREVALKELQDHCADDLDSQLRFLREAEITAALQHPCIVPVYGRGTRPDGRPYYAMRFIDGQSLDAAIKGYHSGKGGTLAFRELLARFVSVCQAIAYAHSRGVIHRDLKPGNVMLGPFGETLVVDWGLARHYDQPDNDPPSDDPLRLSAIAEPSATHAGQVVGTPAYMSPEQAAGRRDVGPASDTYSLGGILYAILTGQSPLPHGLAPLLLAECDRTPPAPRLVKKGVPAALEAVCLRALGQTPQARYASADELARDVQRYLADEPVSVRPEPLAERWRRWSRRNRIAVSGLTALLLVGVVGLGFGLWTVSREQGRTAFQRDEARRAGERAEEEKVRAEAEAARAAKHADEAEKALAAARRHLRQADKNLLLARKAVDDCFVLATGDVGLSDEAAAPFRRRLLAAALPYYREFENCKPGDPALSVELARNLSRLATIEAALDDKDAVRLHGGKARQLCATLAKQPALSADDVQTLADCVNNVGSALHAVGDLADAAATLAEARALQERLIEKRPDDFRARFHLCKMAHNLGVVERTRRRVADALAWYDRSIDGGGELLEANADHAELLGLQASSWRGRAGLLDATDRADEADEAYRKGEALGERLLRHPQVPADDVRTVATTYSDHAAMLSNRGDPAKARRLFLRAIALQEPLCERSSEFRFWHDLGIMSSNLARVCALLGRDDERDVSDKARRVWATLAARRPKDAFVARAASEALAQCAAAKVRRIDALIKSGDHAASARELEQLAADARMHKAWLVNSSAACGRWLLAFAKEAKVNEAQREQMAARGLAFLGRAKSEGALTAPALAWVRKEGSFAPLRSLAGFAELLADEEKQQ